MEECVMSEPPKPLSRLQAYLVEIKNCISLFREVCVEFKDLLVIITVILFFALGVYEALSRLLSPPLRSAGQTVSRPYDQPPGEVGFEIEPF
jgi:hypothetical protein